MTKYLPIVSLIISISTPYHIIGLIIFCITIVLPPMVKAILRFFSVRSTLKAIQGCEEVEVKISDDEYCLHTKQKLSVA